MYKYMYNYMYIPMVNTYIRMCRATRIQAQAREWRSTTYKFIYLFIHIFEYMYKSIYV